MKLIPHGLTPTLAPDGIRSLTGFGNPGRPLAQSVLYPPPVPCEAAPQCISGRTSYLRVRLAFHPYPQLIRRLFNDGRCGPPRKVSSASPWPWVAHPVSGLRPQTKRPLQTRFRSGSAGLALLNLACERNSPARSTKSTRSPVLQAPTACRRTVSGSLSLPSRGAFHLSLTVLVHYRSSGVFSLGGWSPLLPTGFHVPRSTRGQTARGSAPFRVRGCYPLRRCFPARFP